MTGGHPPRQWTTAQLGKTVLLPLLEGSVGASLYHIWHRGGNGQGYVLQSPQVEFIAWLYKSLYIVQKPLNEYDLCL